MIRKFFAAFALIFFVMSSTAFAAEIDGNVIRVTGYGTGPHNWDKHDSFYKTFARQVARMDALAKFAENIGGWDIEENLSGSKVTIIVNPDDKVFKLIETNARQVGKARFLEDGTCEVDMELTMPADWKNWKTQIKLQIK